MLFRSEWRHRVRADEVEAATGAQLGGQICLDRVLEEISVVAEGHGISNQRHPIANLSAKAVILRIETIN